LGKTVTKRKEVPQKYDALSVSYCDWFFTDFGNFVALRRKKNTRRRIQKKDTSKESSASERGRVVPDTSSFCPNCFKMEFHSRFIQFVLHDERKKKKRQCSCARFGVLVDRK